MQMFCDVFYVKKCNRLKIRQKNFYLPGDSFSQHTQHNQHTQHRYYTSVFFI